MKKDNDPKISRRKLLKISAASALSAGIAYVLGEHLERRLTYVSPQEIVDILRQAGIKPKVNDAKGNRTLLVLGDFHLGFGKTYDNFFRNLEQRVSTDRLFMEGVYDHGSDPHIACMRDAAELTGTEFSPSEWKEKDSQGYFRLSENYDVRGIEDRELNNDSAILGKIHIGILSWSMTKNPWVAEKIKELYDRLKVKNFELGSLESMTKDQVESLTAVVKEESWKTMVCQRNNHFTNIIDDSLNPYELGGLIIGEAHCDPSHQDVPEGKYADLIIPYLVEKGINVVYIDVGQAVDYNKNVEDRNET